MIFNNVSPSEHQSRSIGDAAHLPVQQAKPEGYWDDSHLQEKYKLHSPISILPDDVLRYLFTFTPRERQSLGPQFTIRISLVCRSWRLIALDYAFLWNQIFCIDRLDTIRAFIDRSKGALLDISIGPKSKTWATDWPSEFVDILLPHVPQLRRLSFTGKCNEMHYFLQHFNANPLGCEGAYKHNLCATNLEKLSLHLAGESFPIDMGPWFSGHAPKLRSIQLYGGLTPLNQPLLRDVTSLTLFDHTRSDIPLVIAQCPQIYYLRLSLDRHLPPAPLAIPSLRRLYLCLQPDNLFNYLIPCFTPQTWDGLIEIRMFRVKEGVMLETLKKTPQLERLKAYPYESPGHSGFTITSLKKLVLLDLHRGVGSILPYLHLPILQDLRLGFDSTISMRDLINYFARNLFPLKFLSLRGFKPNIDELQSMLAELSFLETLTTTNSSGFARNILQVFNRHPELCPCLWSLDLERCDQNSGIELDLFLYRRRQSKQ